MGGKKKKRKLGLKLWYCEIPEIWETNSLERRILTDPKLFQLEGFNAWLHDPQEEIRLSHGCSYLQWRLPEILICHKTKKTTRCNTSPESCILGLPLTSWLKQLTEHFFTCPKAICSGDFSQTVTFAPIRWDLTLLSLFRALFFSLSLATWYNGNENIVSLL